MELPMTQLRQWPVLIFLLACTAGSMTACLSMRATPNWVERELESPSEAVLWEFSLSALRNQGFTMGSGANPGRLEIVSNWKKDLQAFKGDGKRTRATLRLERLGDGRYNIAVRVEVEVNEDIVQPLDPTFAKWEVAPDDKSMANIIVSRVVARTGVPLEITAGDNAEGVEGWESLQVRASSQRELIEDINRSLLEQGFPLRRVPGTDRRLIQSNWAVSLSQSIGKGRRERAILRVQLLGSGRFRVRANVEEQFNRDRQSPMDEASADWVDMRELPGRARDLLQAIKLRTEG
ncbi:MAG: hypothetical protein ACI841_003726 [Planctomycetota bacterium]|jgi:hypothetical protein